MPPREPTGPPAPGPQTHDAEPFTQVPEQGVRRRSGSQGDQRQLPEKCSAEHRGLGGGGGARGGGEPPPPPLPEAPPGFPALSRRLRRFAVLLGGTCRGPRPARRTPLPRPPGGPGAALGPLTEPVAGPGHPANTLLSQKRLNDTQEPLQDAAQGATQVTHPKVSDLSLVRVPTTPVGLRAGPGLPGPLPPAAAAPPDLRPGRSPHPFVPSWCTRPGAGLTREGQNPGRMHTSSRQAAGSGRLKQVRPTLPPGRRSLHVCTSARQGPQDPPQSRRFRPPLREARVHVPGHPPASDPT